MKLCTITASELPGVTFRGLAALRKFAADRLQYERACQAFERDRNADAFTDDLAALGYDGDEIATHVAARPAYRLPELYA